VLRLGDDRVGGERHDRVKVVRGQRILEVADVVGLPCGDQREVAPERGLEQVAPAADLDDGLALLDQRAQAGGGEDASEADAGGADALDQRALGHELDGDLTGDHPGLGLGVEADVRGDDAGDAAGGDELADPAAGHRSVVGDDGEAAGAAGDQGVDEAVRGTDGHEAADQQRRAVGDQRGRGVGTDRGLHAAGVSGATGTASRDFVRPAGGWRRYDRRRGAAAYSGGDR
jgi:hypothetical protein